VKEKLVTVKVDHPLGSADEDNPSSVYPINAGYVLNESDLELSKHDEKQRAYLVGVDVAVDEYAGILIAVARRRDDSDTVWIVAPENILYNKQQLEEIVHFKEQYYDGFIEMVDEEMWDAYDAQENKLGYEVRRSMAKSMPDGVYHVVVMIYTVTKDGKVLITQRSRNKTNPLKWEVTGGSIIAGESSNEGASRELYEETGLLCKPEELIALYEYIMDILTCVIKRNALHYSLVKQWIICMFHMMNSLNSSCLTDSYHLNRNGLCCMRSR